MLCSAAKKKKKKNATLIPVLKARAFALGLVLEEVLERCMKGPCVLLHLGLETPDHSPSCRCPDWEEDGKYVSKD